MTREIKFRAWDKESKTWAYDESINEDRLMLNYWGLTLDLDGTVELFKGNHCDIVLFKENIIIMQSTGLQDKEGKEIYEGDIVGNKERKSGHGYGIFGTVKFEPFLIGKGEADLITGWVVDYESNIPEHNGDINIVRENLNKNIEVIGNIYENPELLDEARGG